MGGVAPKQHSSRQTRELLEALSNPESSWRYGYDLSKETGLKSGTLYPMLSRLEQSGWLETRWEEPSAPGRPARHLYRLTPAGCTEAALTPQARDFKGERLQTLAPINEVGDQ